MTRDRTHLLLSYMALALAGVGLTCAELDFLPELAAALPVYLVLVGLAWWLGGRWTLPMWAANVLGVVIAGGAALWVWYGLDRKQAWAEDVPLHGMVVPYLGPVLMALLVVRLYRSAPGEFWVLQGLGLLQVALGCVLTSGTLFGLLLLVYLVVALCALGAHERVVQAWRYPTGEAGAVRREGWVGFGVRWTVMVALLAWPLFLLTPRVEGPEWEPLARFAARPPELRQARIGFSEEINLNRTGRLQPDDVVAFRVTVVDSGGRRRDLHPDMRWRGLVLDRYKEQGIWSCAQSWSSGPALLHLGNPPPRPAEGQMLLQFEVPRSTGCLFLAEPLRFGPQRGDLPVYASFSAPPPLPGGRRGPGLFSEVGGTARPLGYLPRSEYRYSQLVDAEPDFERYPAVRLTEEYLYNLIRCPVPALPSWTANLLRRLADRPPALPRLREALDGPQPPGWCLPPDLWEPAARRLTAYLVRGGEYSYSLTQRREAVELDPVMDFLVNVKEGDCERYASALALMLRALGIPARIVKGYHGAEYRGAGTYDVRQSQAHAWVEAVVPAQGGASRELEWIMLEPTPEVDAPVTWASWLQQQQGRAGDVWRDLVVGYGARQQANLWQDLTTGRLLLTAAPPVSLAGGLLLVVLLWRWRRRRARGRAGSDPFHDLYGRLVVLVARPLGVHPRPEQTPRELAGAVAALLEQQTATAALAGVPARVVELLYRARWGGQAPGAAELASAEEELEVLAKQLQIAN
jgi:hypothetical protein